MDAPQSHEVTGLLHEWSAGNEQALQKLTPLVYRELHRAARHYMAGERTAYDHVPNFFSDFLENHMELFGDPQGWKRTLRAGDPKGGKFSELYLDDQDRVQMVIALNPGDDQFETLEKLARQRPSVRGREAEIARPDFSLDALVS